MMSKRTVLIILLLSFTKLFGFTEPFDTGEVGADLSALQKGGKISDFKVANVYADSGGRIVGAKFWHVPSGAPIFLLQIETVPQVYMWVDTPVDSDRGLPHALEHLIAEKGEKGRYFTLLRDMRLSQSVAATWRDFNFYSLTSGSGTDSFFELLHAWLDALYHPDFTDVEAEREFYHFTAITDVSSKTKTLREGGTVYTEELSDEGEETCYHDLDKRILGTENPLAANIGGAPDQLRAVTPREIREFHKTHYRLGPATGFIFALHPKENVAAFLERVSHEFEVLPRGGANGRSELIPGDPKYPINSSKDTGPRVCPVPGANDAAPAAIWFGWKPTRVESMIDFKLLDLFYQGLADGQRSVLHKVLVDSKTRTTNSGATTVKLDLARSESPRFLLWKIEVSGVPGNTISLERIAQVRDTISAKIREVYEYPDGSPALIEFNNVITSYAQAKRRAKDVWMRNPPLFGVRLDADWKDFLEYLDMDSSFVRSLSEDELWRQIDANLKSGKNVWRALIHKFGLLDLPYSEATPSSPKLLKQLESEKQERITNKIKSLKVQYQVGDDQEALARFEQNELAKTKQINQIEARIPKPRFAEHPPLVPDEDMSYSEFSVGEAPVIASLFERPPSIELGLSFDLHQVPSKYYKYLPLLARSFDSLGLKEGSEIIPYQEMSAETHRRFVEFGAGISSRPTSRRADLTFRASAASVSELREALVWMQRSLRSSYLDLANIDRLRDIVAGQISADAAYTKQDEFSWVYTPAQAFRYQDDALYLALDSQFAKAHWDGRLLWLLHKPVTPEEIDRLQAFATKTLANAKGFSKPDLVQNFDKMDAKGLESELIEHWRRNLDSFPADKLIEGLQNLSAEVLDDLRTGAPKTISELKELQEIVVNRRGLHLDLLVTRSGLDELRPELAKFVASIPDRGVRSNGSSSIKISARPIIDKLQKENGLDDPQFPWYVAFVNPEGLTGNAVFYSDFIDYSKTDRASLLRLLSSAILSGRGPGSLYMKAHQAGLAYALTMRGDPSRSLILYYADRSLDVPSLISDMNSAAAGIIDIRDPYVVDYALRQIFSVPRSIYTFSIRERAFAQEIRDGNTPDKVRRFYEALLKLREDPDLLSELTRGAKASLCGILLEEECKAEQRVNHSIFFFVGSEKILSDAEKRLPIPKLYRLWPSDYWLP